VVVERREHLARRGIAAEGTDRAAAERLRKRRRALLGSNQLRLVVIERAAVVAVEEIEPQRLRRRRFERGPHEDHVAERLRHLLAREPHRTGVHPPTDERALSRRAFGLRDLILMVRVDKVAATAVDVDARTEIAERHRRTLDVPAWATSPVAAWPTRTARHAAPQREIDRIPALRVVERGVVLRCEDPEHARRALEDRFVDVRDVLRVTNGSPARLEMTNEDVECEERARVTEVRRVVGRDTADVESDGTGTRTERKDRAPARVVETEH